MNISIIEIFSVYLAINTSHTINTIMSTHVIHFDDNPPVKISEYDEKAQKVIPGYNLIHTMILAILQEYLPPVANILVVGAGTGKELIHLGENHPQWEILGIDPSEKMLEIASHKISQAGLSEQLQVWSGYLEHLDHDTIYDAITCVLVCHFLPDDGGKEKLLRNIYDRLKPSGIAILVDIHGEKGSTEFSQLTSIMQNYWPEVGLSDDKIQDTLNTIKTGVYPMSETRVHELIKQVGFTKIWQFYKGFWIGGWVLTK
jgi:tRNA (cmo5U34)-methyltransferase